MKLLFDENLSPRLPRLLSEEFPESSHISLAGMRGADDARIWDYARNEDLTIVSKDTDFRERSYLDGAPPKIVSLDVGNAGTRTIEELLRNERVRLERFAASDESSILILSLSSKAL